MSAPPDPTAAALAYLTSCLHSEDRLHERLFLELTSTHEAAACFAIGLANVASALCCDLANRSARDEELVLQQLALILQRQPEPD